MRIAIDGRLLGLPGEAGQYSGATLIAYLLLKGPRHQFILVSDRPILAEWDRFPNVEILLLKPRAGAVALRAFWYDFRLPTLLKKHRADVFLGLSGFISLRSPIKQFLWLQDALETEKLGAATPWWGIGYQKRLNAMLKKATTVGVPALGMLGIGNKHDDAREGNSTGGHSQIVREQGESSKFRVMPVVINPFFENHTEKPPSADNVLPEEFTAVTKSGMPYFLCFTGWQTTRDALELLLAFSAFKKRMQSGVRLVLAGAKPGGKAFEEKLATYRYRADVVVLEKLSPKQAHLLLTSAYALIHLPEQPQMNWIFKAMQCRVPVITKPVSPFMDVFADNVLYCTQEPGASLAQHMMQVYKDESMRTLLIKTAYQRCQRMHPEWVAAQILLLLEETK